jgi:hypothetical protein
MQRAVAETMVAQLVEAKSTENNETMLNLREV